MSDINPVYYGSASVTQLPEDEIIEQIYRIVLLRVKTLIVKELQKEDIPEFEQVVLLKDPKALLIFASKKIPQLSNKIIEEFEKVSTGLHSRLKKYG